MERHSTQLSLDIEPCVGGALPSGPVEIRESERSITFIAEKYSIALFCDDCFDAIPRELIPGSVDVVVTSPPYNIGANYSAYDDSVSRREYLGWLERWSELVSVVLQESGSLFLNVGCKPSDPWVPHQVAATIAGSDSILDLHRPTRFQLQNTLHWIKSISIDPEYVGAAHAFQETLSVGHYKPINSPRYVNDTHEYVFHLTKSGSVALDRRGIGVPYQDKSNMTRWSSAAADRRCRGSCWFVPYETIQYANEERPHPATFPVQLAEWAIRLHGLESISLVIDPFLGIGSSALAAARLGRSFVGFEIDPEYYRFAVNRLKDFFRDCR